MIGNRTFLASGGTNDPIGDSESPGKFCFDLRLEFCELVPGHGKVGIHVLAFGSVVVQQNCDRGFQVRFKNQFLGTDICSSKQITGFDEYSHEDENGQMQHYREDYNILTQYNLGTLIIPVSITIIIPCFVVWKKRK